MVDSPLVIRGMQPLLGMGAMWNPHHGVFCDYFFFWFKAIVRFSNDMCDLQLKYFLLQLK
jgi:hypothetical protein